ncbi:MAG: acyl-CoA dehydrogenase family protein, partial [Mesorhizobium sp.]|uniref:acyl-CoA dehydrogenase family protein n=1 Tax=Mesorhizobium sp. TaxID=1871066 RepID=UPI00121CFFC1
DAACRELVAMLGRDGWLKPTAVDTDNPGPLDVRSLCITRETLARHDGLADFAFAMQGLGTGALSLFGTADQRQWLAKTRAGKAISAFAMSVLDVFRSTVGAAALGFARRALDESIKRVAERKLFGAPMAELQMVQGHIADMALDVDAAALLVYRAAWTKDMGAARVTREAAMAKLFATDKAQEVIDKAVQLHGGDGVRKGHIVESLYREIRALRIYEGASDVQKVVIARQVMGAA